MTREKQLTIALLKEKLQKITGKKVLFKEESSAKSLGELLNLLPIRIGINFSIEQEQELPNVLLSQLKSVGTLEGWFGDELLIDTTFGNLPKMNQLIKTSGILIRKISISQQNDQSHRIV